MSKSSPTTPLDRLRKAIAGPGPEQPGGTPPQTVTGPLGTVPGAAVQADTTRTVPPARQLSDREARTLMQAELLAAVRSLVDSSTELAARLGRRGAVNGVLDVWAGVLPTGGTLFRSYEVTIGSMRITNHSAATTLTVQSGVPAGDTGAQAAGTGVQYIQPGQTHSFAAGDRSWTVTGTAGEKVSVQAFTGLQALGVSVL